MTILKSESVNDDPSVRMNKEHTDVLKTIDKAWMLRECSVYSEEYRACSSLVGRLHQRYVHGQTLDCQQWKDNENDCLQWKQTGNKSFAESIIGREERRIAERLRGHTENDVWEHRDTEKEGPPANWKSELPLYLKDSGQLSLLSVHSRGAENFGQVELAKAELKNSITFFCSIM